MVWTPGGGQPGIHRYIQERPELADRDPHEVYLELRGPEIPLGREQTPEEFGKMVAFLASEDARNVTGQCIHIDGGMLIRD